MAGKRNPDEPEKENIAEVNPSLRTKKVPSAKMEEKKIPDTAMPKKELPMVGTPENTVMIGGKPIEIKPTKLKYQRNRTATFYKLLDIYP